ncbi:hypothetical protein DTO012A7_2465 [Penicillium roqueforti]|nr:hypothetical protein DTO012A7_2465 [Penicillium roqueforti]
MSPDQRSQRPQRIERETLSSSTWDLHDQSHLRHLVLPGKSLLFTLELLQSYQTVLQADMNLTRLFHIPLTSDLKADGLDTLFSKRRPHVLEADPAGCTIHWADVVLSATYDPKQQSDSNHHARVDKCKALVEVSKEDHDFIATGLPRQLVDPHSYPCDVASEINIVKLTRSQIAPWKDLTLQLNQTIDNVLAGLSGRVEKLQQKYLKFGLQGNSSDEFTRSGSEASITPKNSDGSPLAKQGKKRKGQNHSWTPEEARDLPGWFKQHQNLSEKEITEQYLLFSGQDRSYPSLQAQLYKQGFGYLCNKKKKPSHGQRAASQLPPSAPALSATRECNDPTQFSVAMNIISRSLYPFQQQSSGTQTVENEIELGRSPSRNAQKGRSSSEKAESDPELAVEPNCPCLNVTQPGSYGHSSAVEVISVSTNKTVGRSKESLAAASPGLQPSVSQCRSKFDCTDELQESLLEPADRPDGSPQSPVQSNPDEHIGVRPESLLPAESCDRITHGRSPDIAQILQRTQFP